MIIREYETIFVHIPKSAGTSVESYFGNGSFAIQPLKHDNIYQIKKRFPEIYKTYRKFAIIRNPYDKMVSWYFYLKRNLGDYNVIEFNEWIKDPTKFWHIDDPISFLDPQHSWIDDTVEIIKFENLNKELSKFFDFKIDLPITNKSDHDHYLSYYNEESLDIIYKRYKKDFKKFKYKKI